MVTFRNLNFAHTLVILADEFVSGFVVTIHKNVPTLSRVKSFRPLANCCYFTTLPFRFIMIKNYDWSDMNYDQARLQSERTAE